MKKIFKHIRKRRRGSTGPHPNEDTNDNNHENYTNYENALSEVTTTINTNPSDKDEPLASRSARTVSKRNSSFTDHVNVYKYAMDNYQNTVPSLMANDDGTNEMTRRNEIYNRDQANYVWNTNNLLQSDSSGEGRQDIRNNDRLVRRPRSNNNIVNAAPSPPPPPPFPPPARVKKNGERAAMKLEKLEEVADEDDKKLAYLDSNDSEQQQNEKIEESDKPLPLSSSLPLPENTLYQNNYHGYNYPAQSAENIPPPLESESTSFPTHSSLNTGQPSTASTREPDMPDSTYEEFYGDSYVGAPLRYIYPNGYQTMRPRSGPWKLSLVIFSLFMWLSIFVVGYCADMVEYNGDGGQIDDDALVIDVRWCGSQMLYFMWVVSMIITGISAAYCSIIGYIKVRDFAVANCRSQPPGMEGKSDFYVRIGDSNCNLVSSSHHSNYFAGGNKNATDTSTQSIYQADGTPQFWGGHIYRPTQAAVAVTSR